MRPKRADGRGDHRGDGVGIGDVGNVARRLAAGGFDGANGLVHVGVRMQRVDHHVGAPRGKRARDRAADVAGAAGDERDLAGQFALRRGFAGVAMGA